MSYASLLWHAAPALVGTAAVLAVLGSGQLCAGSSGDVTDVLFARMPAAPAVAGDLLNAPAIRATRTP